MPARIRVSKAQARLFANGKGKARAPRSGPTPEAQVTEQVIGWLRAKGWSCTRRQVGLFVSFAEAKRGVLRPITIGEKGESDWFCERALTCPGDWIEHVAPGLTQAFTLEIKAPGNKPTAEQDLWMRRRRSGGFLALWVDSLEGIIAAHKIYFESHDLSETVSAGPKLLQ